MTDTKRLTPVRAVSRQPGCRRLVVQLLLPFLLVLPSCHPLLAPPDPLPSIYASDYAQEDAITVSWNYDAEDTHPPYATSFRVYRAASDHEEPVPISPMLSGCELSWTDRGVLGVYWYKIAACNSIGCSELSEPDRGSTSVIPPTGVRASRGQQDRIVVTWDACAVADSYDVYRNSDITGVPILIGTTDEPALVNHGSDTVGSNLLPLRGGIEYTYRIKACHDGRCSEDYSDPAVGSLADS